MRQLNEQKPLLGPACDRPLIAAYHDLAECLRPSGPYGEIDEWSIYDESLRRLVDWAESAKCFHEDLQPLKEGGREHDLTFIEAFIREDVAVFDLRPANVVHTIDGVIVPIDAIPVRLDENAMKILNLNAWTEVTRSNSEMLRS